MKIAFFSAKSYEKTYFSNLNHTFQHEITYFENNLTEQSALLAKGYDAVCAFVNDTLDKPCIETLSVFGVKVIALRSAGYNHVDIKACLSNDILVCYVPDYSPHSVAEHTFALLLTMNRKIHKAYHRVREGDFSLTHLMGKELHGKTMGLIGYGRIGQCVANIANGFGMKVLIVDPSLGNAMDLKEGCLVVSLPQLLTQSDILSLHCPLTDDTHHIINHKTIKQMKSDVMLLNTGRGGLIDHKALLSALKTKKIGAVGLDVYEQEQGVFFYDHSEDIVDDDVLMRLMTFPNVLITSHQGFFTHEALTNITTTTLQNLQNIEQGKPCLNIVPER